MNMKKIFGKKLVKNAQAVSPIIATLMLVLVAVGSAGAFYVWQSGWQGGIEDKVEGSGELQASLSIGGSSTVYEFSAIAAEYYHAANPNYKVSYQKGGSGAGVASVGMGAVDIGSASRYVKSSEKAEYPDLNKDGNKDFGRELVEHVVAWDAVAVVVSDTCADAAALITSGLTKDDMRAVYYVNGGAANSGVDTIWATADDVGPSDVGVWMFANSPADNSVSWDEIPLIGSANINAITIYDRDEESGTEEVFSKQIIDTGKGTLEAAGITANHETSNQNLLTAIAADADALSFMSFGMADMSGSGLDIIPFEGDNDATPVMPSETTIMDQTYDGARPLVYITVGEPTGDIKVYIDFCLQPENNQNICTASDYISIY